MFSKPQSRWYSATLSPQAREFFKDKNRAARFLCKYHNGDDYIEIDGFKFRRSTNKIESPPKRGFWERLFSLRR